MKLPDVGTLFEGRYELAAELGRGGFAAVYRAIDRSVQREVAIKVLLPSDDAQSEANSARFLREARMLSQFQHPNIVTLFDSGQSNGLLYMVFEYVAGRDLATVLKEDGPIDPASVVHMLDQLLDALHVAHTQGLLHRDVKPANVLVHTYYDDPYRVKLLDFGIAKLVDGNETRQLTKTGMVVGTIRYMAPEQLFGEPLDARTDLYALGLVGTEMLTGKPVIDGPSQRDLMAAQAASTPLVVPADAAPPTLRTVLERAMARAPEHRWPAAAAMRNALFAERSGPISRPLAPAPGFGSGPQPGVPRSGPHHAVHRTGPQASVARPYSGPHQAPPKARSPFLTWGPLIVGIAFGVGLVLFALSDSSESNNRIAAAPAPRLVVQPTNTEPTSAQGHEPTQASADTPDQNEATVDGTGGCGKPSPGSYDSRLDLDWPGGPVDAYIPDGYDGTEALPIVMLFHRKFRNGRYFLNISQFKPLADKHRFVVLAPDTKTPMGWSNTEMNAIPDVLSAAHELLCIDPKRLYFVGDETGEKPARKIACQIPTSAYAITMGVTAQTCKLPIKTARLRIWGKNDKTLPPEGGLSCSPIEGDHTSAERMRSSWLRSLECDASAGQRWRGHVKGGECTVWACERGYLGDCATDGDHHWPGSQALLPTPACKSDPPEHDFPMAETIWRFFAEYGTLIEPERPTLVPPNAEDPP